MKFTIFTPTYNRAHLLPRLFGSLMQLDFHDFEWLIADDGSADETKSVVSEFASKAHFPIRYFWQQNQGKHAAINLGVKEACGEFFYIVDSDDWLPADALTIILKFCRNLQPGLAGVCGKKSVGNKTVNLPFDQKVCTPVQIRYQYGIAVDLAEVYRTEILKNFPFPVFKGEKFVTESMVWFRIAQHHKMLYFDEVICHCEYQLEGLSNNYRKLMENNPKGTLLYFSELLKCDIPREAKKTAARNFNSIAQLNGYSRFWIFRKLGLRNYLRIFF